MSLSMPGKRKAGFAVSSAVGARANGWSHASVGPEEDWRALEAELRHKVQGEVRFDDGSKALYSTDASNYRQIPIGIVIPQTVEDIVQAVATARQFGAPILPRGCGTSLAGQCCNVAVVMDMSKYLNRVLAVDPDGKMARVQPGTILDELRNAAEHYHLTFGPDPATHDHCTVGGMIGNNSCGVHSIMAGMTSENVEELDVLTYDGLRMRVAQTSQEEFERIIGEGGRRGQIYAGLMSIRDRYAELIRTRYPDIPRRVSGYNLVDLLPERGFNVARALVGSEGTCVTVLEAKVRIVHSPPARSLLVLGYPTAYHAADHVPEIMSYRPVGLEGFDDVVLDYMKAKQLNQDKIPLLPDGGGWLLVEFGAEQKEEADSRGRELMDALSRSPAPPNMKLFSDPREASKIWAIRESGLGAVASAPGKKETWEGWEDASVPPERLGGYLRDLKKLLDRYGYETGLYGHFGQGCVHTRIDFDFKTASGVRNFRSFMHEAADIVLSHGGSLSGEHGDGQSRAEMLVKMFGSELMDAFREFKTLWDPEWKMNPGKLINPYRMDENLRISPSYNPRPTKTQFQFQDDHHSFAHAAARCAGVGKCRRLDGGTMCPSFMVTREEAHSTRGRARLLFEMLQGSVLKDGWHDEHVKESLDLCLSCKGCKGDCPVNVDMATYKAEFLSHYYSRKLRPISAYAFGLIMYWTHLAEHAPRLANLLTQTPLLRRVAKAAVGMPRQRRIPAFATQTFKQRFRNHSARNSAAPKVILWADTFNNHFTPPVAEAAVEVLEAAGYRVEVPSEHLCCGRPLYDYGMLGLAKRLLRQILRVLGPDIEAGVPIVGLEPSCVAVFRDELPNLFPLDENALRLSRQVYTLAEFLNQAGYEPTSLRRKALIHGHCHQKAVMKMEEEGVLLSRLGLDYQILDSGCCGMAGSFGFEKQHYDVSIAVGERSLLPSVRAAEKATLIVADGFSCREQIAQTTDRQALHLAQVIQMALTADGHGSDSADYPERQFVVPSAPTRSMIGIAMPLVGTAVVAGLAWRWFKRGR
jgi:FAD/FMN-containing dehydrogenase/Fe-S oxidoreductase